jgi:hypothetical protein
VVRVAAVTAPATSPAPITAAAGRGYPCRRQRSIASRTTIELSTNMPMPRARPPSDMMLSVTPSSFIGRKVASTDTGMVTATTAVARGSLKKKNRTMTARIPPTTAADQTCPMAAEMYRA